MWQDWIVNYENIIKNSKTEKSKLEKEANNNKHLLRDKIMNIKDGFAFWLLEL